MFNSLWSYPFHLVCSIQATIRIRITNSNQWKIMYTYVRGELLNASCINVYEPGPRISTKTWWSPWPPRTLRPTLACAGSTTRAASTCPSSMWRPWLIIWISKAPASTRIPRKPRINFRSMEPSKKVEIQSLSFFLTYSLALQQPHSPKGIKLVLDDHHARK